jgi:hypothetical protein
MYYILKEVLAMIAFSGDIEIYNLINNNSPLFLDYSQFAKEHPEENFTGFDRVESVYSLDPMRVAPVTYAHSQEDEKITALCSPMFSPLFYRMKSYMPLRKVETQFPELRLKYEPWNDDGNERTMRLLHFMRELHEGSNLPQIFHMN